jgi:hypothetical protein
VAIFQAAADVNPGPWRDLGGQAHTIDERDIKEGYCATNAARACRPILIPRMYGGDIRQTT